jgi:hypothetical protein
MFKMPSHQSQQIPHNSTSSTNAAMQLAKPEDTYGFIWTIQNI